MQSGLRKMVVGVAAWVAAGAIAFGQNSGTISGQVFTTQGRPAANAAVRVCPNTSSGSPCEPVSNIYSDPDLTHQISNPTTADQYGNYSIFVSSGVYLVQITSSPNVVYNYLVSIPSGGGGGGGNLNGPQLRVPMYANPGVATTLGPTGGTNVGGVSVDQTTQSILSKAQSLDYPSNPTTPLVQQNLQMPVQTAAVTGNLLNYMQTAVVPNGGLGGAYASVENINWSGQGANNGNQFNCLTTTGNCSWTNTTVHKITDIAATNGIHQWIGLQQYCMKMGDCAAWYSYLHYAGGWHDASGEGATPVRVQGWNLASEVWFGQVATVTHDPTYGYVSRTTSNQNLPYGGMALQGGWVMNESDTADALNGYATGYDGVNNIITLSFDTDAPVLSAPSAVGTTAAVVSNIPFNVNGVLHSGTTAIDVTMNSGTFSPGFAMMACADGLDPIWIQAVGTLPNGHPGLTAVTQMGHQTGCPVIQGGTMGILDFIGDRLPVHYRTSYFVANATDDNHIHVYIPGPAQQYLPINTVSRHNFGVSVNGVTLTRTAGVLKACNLGAVGVPASGDSVLISGAGDSSFNGTVAVGTLDASGCVSGAQTGSDGTTTGTVATGGTVGTRGQITIWPAAMVKQAGTTSVAIDNNGHSQNILDGSLTYWPNNLPSPSTSDMLSIPYDMVSKLETLSAFTNIDTPVLGSDQGSMRDVCQGFGMAGGGQNCLQVRNLNPYTYYANGGGTGQLPTPVGIRIQGPFGPLINADAPFPGLAVLQVNKGQLVNTGYPDPYLLWNVQGQTSGGFTQTWDPYTYITALSTSGPSGTAGITLAPNALTLSSGGSITLAATTYTFTGAVTIPTLTATTFTCTTCNTTTITTSTAGATTINNPFLVANIAGSARINVPFTVGDKTNSVGHQAVLNLEANESPQGPYTTHIGSQNGALRLTSQTSEGTSGHILLSADVAVDIPAPAITFGSNATTGGTINFWQANWKLNFLTPGSNFYYPRSDSAGNVTWFGLTTAFTGTCAPTTTLSVTNGIVTGCS